MEMGQTAVTTITAMYGVAMLCALVGNCLLIYIVWRKPEVRSLTSSMFVNMAVTDLLVAFFMMPFYIVHLHTKSQWKISELPADLTCRSFILISYTTSMASILCLVFMAIDRFYAVFYPLMARAVWFRKAKIVSPMIWISSTASMAIMPFIYKLNYEFSLCEFHPDVLGNQTQTFRIVFLYIFRSYYNSLKITVYLIRLGVISPLYSKIARKIWSNYVPGNSSIVEHQRGKREDSKRKLIRMLIIIVVVFALSWLPAQIIHLIWAIRTFYFQPPVIAMYLGFWLAHANSAINPWPYIALSSRIRLAFTRMLRVRNSHEV
ncbi:unnamed protein product, partial [Porites lobata]